MKKNKRNKILTLLSALTLFTFTIGGVKAEELNAATCKDREKYTYYFYFANAHDAIAIQNDLTYNKYESLKAYFHQIGEVTNSTTFNNIPSLIGNTTLKAALNDKNKYNQATGIIYVTHNATSEYSNIKTKEYWEKVKEINESGKTYVKDNEKEVHMLHGAYANYTGNVQGAFQDSRIDFFINETSGSTYSAIDALVNSSIETKNTKISYDTDVTNDTDLKFHIVRDYSEATDTYGLTTFNISAAYGRIYENASDTTGTNKNWYLQPVVYYIEVCEKASLSDFTISYDADGGENAPAKQEGEAGTCVTISEKEPTKENETFLGWYLKSNPSSSDKKYVAGDEYCGELGDITLYAEYTGDTGVEEYFIAFIIVAIAAGGILVITKKKRLFSQI